MENDAPQILLGSLQGKSVNEEERNFLRQEPTAGVTLFSRNLDSNDPAQVQELTREIQSLRPSNSPPLIIAIDQEGGRVSRLKKPFPNMGPALHICDGNDDPKSLDHIFQYGFSVGKSLKELGINVNFAPVVDCLSNPLNDAIGDRAFSEKPDKVTKRAGAFLGGLQQAGVFGCLKHFPGQGDANYDTHLQSAQIDVSIEQLEKRELTPFVKLLEEAPLVMISHCIYPSLDTKEASLSSVIMKELLREKLGFDGLVVSDDMTMGAITKSPTPWERLLIEAVTNGSDLALICNKLDAWEQAVSAFREESDSNPSFCLRVGQAAKRVRAFREKIGKSVKA
ncbi:MAG: beta-N-acetylhexosaminidase [Oligoflexales bacterium]|nr:beta-N-acetylhexosaminidase [Oligoflexales bacterium]